MTEPHTQQMQELMMSSRESLDRLADFNARRIAHLTACLDTSHKEAARLRALLASNTSAPAPAPAPVPAHRPQTRPITHRKPRTAPSQLARPIRRDRPAPSPAAPTASRAWTPDEQARYAAAVATHGPRAWPQITAIVATRTQKQVRAYAQRHARRLNKTPAPAPTTTNVLVQLPENNTSADHPGAVVPPKTPDLKNHGYTLAMHHQPMSPVTPAPPSALPHMPASRDRPTAKKARVGFKGLGPFAPEAVAAARLRMSAHTADQDAVHPSSTTDKSHTSPSASTTTPPDLPEAAGSFSCSSLSSCGRNESYSLLPSHQREHEYIVQDNPLQHSLDFDSGGSLEDNGFLPWHNLCQATMEESMLTPVHGMDDMDEQFAWASRDEKDPFDDLHEVEVDSLDDVFATEVFLEDM